MLDLRSRPHARRRPRRWLRRDRWARWPPVALTVSLLALPLSSCGLPQTLVTSIPDLLGGNAVMRVSIAEALNDSSPVPVDLVMLYDKEVLTMLGKITAQEWFRGGKRQQFFREHSPYQAEAYHWEWAPGQSVEEQILPYRAGVKGGVIFADYYFPGEHRAQVDLTAPFLLTLAEKDFTLEPLR